MIRLIGFLSLVAGILFAGVTPVHAVSSANWQAGRIIDDTVFTDSSDMSISQIQDFLNQKVGTGGYGLNPGQCDVDGISPSEYGGGTRAQYGAGKGNPAPFTCLKDYYEVPKTEPGGGIPVSNYGLPVGQRPTGSISAAEMIYNAAQRYSINPKVLLVTIQKESAGPLTTDDWPLKSQYTYAMGAHCPDSGPGGSANCDPAYAGFSIQISESAALLRFYLDNMNQPWWTYKKPGYNDVLYNPNLACGKSTISIADKSTAALYTYTPYQPNQLALDNMYGTGDSCSAYGNRNFWRIFTDWFGTTYSPEYKWQYAGQQTFVDQANTRPVDINTLAPNSQYYLKLSARNMGNTTWSNTGANPINLTTVNEQNRQSMFCNPTWPACNRPATLREAIVAPGDVGTFEFLIQTPVQPGVYNERFSLVSEGKSWMNDIGLQWPITVKPPTYAWVHEGQTLTSDSAHTKSLAGVLLSPSAMYYLQLKVRNMGNTTWSKTGANPITLGTSNPRDRNSLACTAGWINCRRSAVLEESIVTPGQIGTFNFPILTPGAAGTYNEYFTPVAEGASWMNDLGLYWQLNVAAPTYSWKFESQNVYTDSSKTQSAVTTSTPGGSRFYAVLKARNTGNTTWSNNGANPVRLGTNNPENTISSFCDATWLICNRAATLKENSVAPGDVGTFEFWVTAPYAVNDTILKDSYNLVSEGKAWMNDIGMYYTYTMQTTDYVWQYSSQGSYTDSARTISNNLSATSKNSTYYLRLKARNVGGKTWTLNGLNLGTANPKDRISLFCTTSWLDCNRAGALKETSVAPGQIGTFDFPITTPNTLGTYKEYFTPVKEGVAWLNDLGLYWQIIVSQ